MTYIITWQALLSTAVKYGKEQDPVKKAELKKELTYLEDLAKDGSTTFFPNEAP